MWPLINDEIISLLSVAYLWGMRNVFDFFHFVLSIFQFILIL